VLASIVPLWKLDASYFRARHVRFKNGRTRQ
jgi:hypothetical protein